MAESELLHVRFPESWPSPPKWMSYSTVTSVESCPRQWSLKRGSYPEVWSKSGYPTRTSLPILRGRVVHQSIETILHALQRSGSAAVQSAEMVRVLKDLGGISKIIKSELQKVLEKHVFSNPRMMSLGEDMQSRLEAEIGTMRAKVQSYLTRLDVAPGAGGTRVQTTPSRTYSFERTPLSHGVYAEQEVQAPSLGWKGHIDMLSLQDELCEISDFKTGQAKEEHADQVRLYALIWWLDSDLNPSGRVADVLRLLYPSTTVEVPAPSVGELEELKDKVKERGQAAREAILERPPAARPEKELCEFCSVRHLCEAYWSSDTQDRFGALVDDVPDYVDIELRLIGRRTEGMWHARVLSSIHWDKGQEVIFEPKPGPARFDNLAVLRLLGARVRKAFAEGRVVLTESRYTEVFLLSGK